MDFTIEELTMNAWPSLQTMFYKGWVLRMSNGYTKRANSIIPIYHYNEGIPEKISYCEEICKKNNLPAIFKITNCNEHIYLDQELNNLNYKIIDLTSVQICENLIPVNNEYNGIIINNYFSEEWKDGFCECSGINDSKIINTAKVMLENIKMDYITVCKKVSDKNIGFGFGVIENGFVGLFDIFVNREYRGKGYGNEIVQTILSEAYNKGIRKAYLSVVDNNIVAKNLYNKLGFNENYKYWYRRSYL